MIPIEVDEALKWVGDSLKEVGFGEIELRIVMHQGHVSKILQSRKVTTQVPAGVAKNVKKTAPEQRRSETMQTAEPKTVRRDNEVAQHAT